MVICREVHSTDVPLDAIKQTGEGPVLGRM